MGETKEPNLGDKQRRVQVGNLQQQERQLKNHEAKSVKGGGVIGGVDVHRGSNRAAERTTIGEEIPS